jgi:hypothetical protein
VLVLLDPREQRLASNELATAEGYRWDRSTSRHTASDSVAHVSFAAMQEFCHFRHRQQVEPYTIHNRILDTSSPFLSRDSLEQSLLLKAEPFGRTKRGLDSSGPFSRKHSL